MAKSDITVLGMISYSTIYPDGRHEWRLLSYDMLGQPSYPTPPVQAHIETNGLHYGHFLAEDAEGRQFVIRNEYHEPG